MWKSSFDDCKTHCLKARVLSYLIAPFFFLVANGTYLLKIPLSKLNCFLTLLTKVEISQLTFVS